MGGGGGSGESGTNALVHSLVVFADHRIILFCLVHSLDVFADQCIIVFGIF